MKMGVYIKYCIRISAHHTLEAQSWTPHRLFLMELTLAMVCG